MRIGIIGDIHANLEALSAVLEALDESSIDQMLCAGDVVGYGASPGECIELVREREIPTVKGNHDEYTCQIGADWHIHPHARTVILWNQQALDQGCLDWLESLPRIIRFEDVQVVHASHTLWPPWPYVMNPKTAVASFLFQSSRISFNAHSHVPVYVWHQSRKRPEVEMLRNMFLPRKHRVLIGVGSVGQPRDGDPRACCVIYDSAEKSVRIMRVPYDIERAQAKIREAGLPDELARRLEEGN